MNFNHVSKKPPPLEGFFLFVCKIRYSGKNEIHIRKRYPVPPHLIFRRISVRVLQPFDDLISGSCFFGIPHHTAVRLKHIHPEPDFLIGRFRRFQVGTPPVRESLEPCAFRRGQPAYRIVHVYQRRILVIRGHQ